MKRKVELETWDRKDVYQFFSTFLNPTICITSEVECGGAKQRAKEAGESFFIHYLYAVLQAANEITEMHYRIEGGQVMLYDRLDNLSPIKVNEQGKFVEVLIPYSEDFSSFYREAKRLIGQCSAEGDPYAYVNGNREMGIKNNGMILLSALPDLYFTSITTTQQFHYGGDYPLLNAGKAVMREGKLVMPLSINVHHGLVDGSHLSRFFHRVEELLK